MAGEIKHENPILIGVSFGGIMVQEMSKFVNAKQVIIISSVKSNTEFPKRFKFIGMSNIYKLFPTKFMTNFERYSKFFIGKTLQKKAENYKRYFTERNKTYLEWSIENVLKWQQVIPNDFVIHIHGTDDSVFPIKYIQNAIEIPNGNHAMIITKAKEISEILNNKMIIT
jgi:esterase/lipase